MSYSPKILARCAILSAVVGSTVVASAQEKAKAEGKLPPAREVIAQFVHAIGGKETVLKHRSAWIKGKWEITNLGQNGDFELVRAKPNKQILRIRMGEQGQVVNGYDGKVGWMLNPLGGPMLLEGKLLEQASEEAEFYNVLRDENSFKSMETVGAGQFEGNAAIELKLVTRSGRESREFYDPKTGLLLGTKGVQETPQGPNEITIAYHDYKKLGDVLRPTRLAVKASGFEQVLTISSVEYDSVPEKAFELPEEIKGLLKK